MGVCKISSNETGAKCERKVARNKAKKYERKVAKNYSRK